MLLLPCCCVLPADIDECRADPELCQPGLCKNTYGSYYCECQQGYSVKQGSTACSGKCLVRGRPRDDDDDDDDDVL